MWHNRKFTVSEEPTVSIFYSEDRGSTFLQTAGTLIPDYMVLHPMFNTVTTKLKSHESLFT
jgi:hypothetical protein